MAQVLVRLKSNTHQDALKDERGSWKRGHPVAVRPDGATWGRLERLPDFAVLEFPGVAVSKLLRYLGGDVVPGTETARPVTLRRSLWRVRVDDVPAAIRTKIVATGRLVVGAGGDVSWTAFRAYLHNDRTGLDETRAL